MIMLITEGMQKKVKIYSKWDKNSNMRHLYAGQMKMNLKNYTYAKT